MLYGGFAAWSKDSATTISGASLVGSTERFLTTKVFEGFSFVRRINWLEPGELPVNLP